MIMTQAQQLTSLWIPFPKPDCLHSPPTHTHSHALQSLDTVPKIMSPETTCLNKVVLLCIHAATVQTFWKSLILLPPCTPFIHGHNLEAIAQGGVDLNWIASLDLCPLPATYNLIVHASHDNIPVQSSLFDDEGNM